MTSGFTKALVIGALSSLGALAWSGCGPGSEERYFCDNGGCQSCDAYGCSNVGAAPKAKCSSTQSCQVGVCTTDGCAETCASDSNCPRGNTCQQGLCAAPGKTPVPVPSSSVDAGPGPSPSGDGGPTAGCGGGTSCTGAEVCVSGVCTAPENTCKFTSECGTDKVCAEGACLTPCGPTTACTGDYTCTKNVCQPNQPTPTDGGTGPVSCTTDPICGTGNYCNNGTCAVDNRPKPNCTTDTTCGGTVATPKKCLVGFCKYTCSTDQYCKTIDNRIGYCAKDGVCRSASEAAASCTGPGTCSDGKSCIDNQCK